MSRYIAGVLVIFIFLSGALSSMARGTSSSGGGGAFVCRSPETGEIVASHFLDIWEENVIRKNPIHWSNDDVEAQLERALSFIKTSDEYFGILIEEQLHLVRDQFHILPEGVGLPAPPDANPKFIKEGCTFEGMMYYDGEGERLLARKSVFEKLATQTDVAAAFLHEAVYKLLREKLLHRTSRITRRYVGCAMSMFPESCLGISDVESLISDKNESWECHGNEASIFVSMNNDKMRLYVSKYEGYFFGTPMILEAETFESGGECLLSGSLLAHQQEWSNDYWEEAFYPGLFQLVWSDDQGKNCDGFPLEAQTRLGRFYLMEKYPNEIPVVDHVKCEKLD